MPRRLAVLLLVLALPLPAADAPRAAKPKFADAVEAEHYPSASLEEQPVLRWDFSKKRDYRFRLEQTSEGTTSFGAEREMKTSSSANGDLIVRTPGDRTAKLVFENTKVTMRLGDEDTPVAQDVPTTVVAGMNDDGTSSTTLGQQAFLKLLFPLPPKPLGVGESVDQPVEIPFSASGSSLLVKGTNHITNAGSVMVGKRLCVQLETEMQIGKLDVPEEIAGKYEFAMSGRSVFFFDVQTHSFVRGVLALTSRMHVDAEQAKMNITSDDLIRITAAD